MAIDMEIAGSSSDSKVTWNTFQSTLSEERKPVLERHKNEVTKTQSCQLWFLHKYLYSLIVVRMTLKASQYHQ